MDSRPITIFCLVALVLGLAGCQSLGYGKKEKLIDVSAQYTGLADKRVAVVVSTNDHTAFNYPKARAIITNEVSRRIMTNVPGAQVSDPKEVLVWQDENAYWATRPPSMLIRQLNVDRLVLVEVGEYRTHEPGDKHVLRGVISATVNIVSADAVDPDNFDASFTKNVMFPTPGESKVGRVGDSQSMVEQVTQLRFSEEVAGLFFDHQIIR